MSEFVSTYPRRCAAAASRWSVTRPRSRKKCAIYSRAFLLAQVSVVSILVLYARVSTIAPECTQRMQHAIDDYIWLSNAPESVRQADAGRPIQRHVKATAVYAPLNEGGLPVQRLENVLAANQA